MDTLHQHECHSVHSRWSDSNSVGPTIPIHTFAKPLAKFLHHRQVTTLLAKYYSSALSAELLDLLTIYLESKEISSATKTLILRDLNIRAAQEAEARAIVKENGLPSLIRLLDCSDPDILEATCTILETLALYTTLNPEIMNSYPFVRIISLTLNKNRSVRKQSLYLLRCLANLSEESAQAIVNAGALQAVAELLPSTDSDFVGWASDLLDSLARCSSVNSVVAESIPYHCLVAAVEQAEPSMKSAMSILLSISDGGLSSAHAFAVEANLQWTRKMLDSPSLSVVKFACRILGNIAQHDSLVESVVQLAPCQRLLSLMRYADSVATDAIYTVTQMCRVDVGMYSLSNSLLELLGSAEDAVVKSSCQLLGNLARNVILNTAIANSACCRYLVSFIGKKGSAVDEELEIVMLQIGSHDAGARAVADAMIEALSSPQSPRDPIVLARLCRMLGHTSLSFKVASLVKVSSIVPLLLNEDVDVQEASVYMFRCIYEMSGATTAIEILLKLLNDSVSSPHPLDPAEVTQICRVIAAAAVSSRPTAPDLIRVLPLALLLWDDDISVAAASLYMFQRIYGMLELPSVAEILLKMLNDAMSAPQPFNPIVLSQLCRMLGHTSLSFKVASLVKVSSIVPLLLNEDVDVQEASVYMFRCIYKMPGATTAIEILLKLLNDAVSSPQSLDPAEVTQICRVIAAAAVSSRPTAPDLIRVFPLTLLLWDDDISVAAASLYMFQRIYGMLELPSVAEILLKMLNDAMLAPQPFNPIVLSQLCRMLGDEACSLTNAAHWKIWTFVPLLDDHDPDVQASSAYLFRRIYGMPRLTSTTEILFKVLNDAVLAQPLDHILLCRLCRLLGRKESSIPQSIEVSSFVPLLMNSDSEVQTSAVYYQ
ncbi:hypothetical protein MVEN_01085400 [Mycena venus]|uniref:Vacuolar protein 8 n=1 Tax=Mycena venus TaxID=2733690 RepID=A0A8H6Y4F4_9AGAR|nr:hypothetical protein MVEN_01085400 [Mycena venus]